MTAHPTPHSKRKFLAVSAFILSSMIRKTIPLCLLLTALPTLCVAAESASDPWIALWNGKNLDGWSSWLNKPNRNSKVPGLARDQKGKYLEAIGSGEDPLKVFTVVAIDGKPALRISGEVFGELRSHQSLENYHLRLQFKWGKAKWPPRHKAETPRDSGLLYHFHSRAETENRNWSRSIELQIQEGDCGDLYAVGSTIAVRARYDKSLKHPTYTYDSKGTWTWFSQIPGQSGRCIKFPDAENPSGEWNTIELICFGKQAIHIINGKVVMRLHGPTRIDGKTPQPITSGPIILQSEGSEIFYRQVEYRLITEIPRKYR